MTTSDPRSGGTPGVRSDVPGVRPSGTGEGTPGPAPSRTPDPAPDRASGGPAPAARPAGRDPKHGAGRSIGLGLAAALLVFVTVVLVLFVMFNTRTVDISLVFGDVRAPLVLALLVAAALGGLLVGLAGAVLRARRRKS